MKDSKALFKNQIKKIFDEGKYIGVLINTDTKIRKPLIQIGLSEKEILNDLRYFKSKGYFNSYDNNPDNLEEIKLTADGQDWLENKTIAVKIEKIKWYYNPYFVAIITVLIFGLILLSIEYKYFVK